MQPDPAPALNLASVVQGLIVVGIIWIARSSHESAKQLVELKTILTGGKDGNGGITGEVTGLRGRMHNAENEIHVLKAQDAVIEIRIKALENGQQAA